jgi:transcription elongation GreA/GreB family factor
MKLNILSRDAEKIQEIIRVKEADIASFSLKLGDAMSRSGSFPASNPEYAAVHLEIKNLQNNIDHLKEVLSKYTTIDADKVSTEEINTYSLVTLENEETGERSCYYVLLAELEKDIPSDCFIATPESPVGQALIGCRLEDSVEIVLPTGKKKYRIIDQVKEF